MKKEELAGRSELYVPWSQAILSKTAMAFPWIVGLVWPLLEKSGEKKKAAFQRSADRP